MGYVDDVRAIVGNWPLVLVGSQIVVVDDADNVLYIRRHDNGLWGMPGGSLEPGETVEEAGRRELTEETGLVAGRVELLGVLSGPEQYVEYANGHRAWWVTTVFLAESVSGELHADGVEALDARWFPRTDPPADIDPADAGVLRLLAARG